MNELTIDVVLNKSVCHVARQFKWTVETLYANSGTSEGAIALIVNAAFALELYLKSLNFQIVFKDPYPIEPGVRGYDTVINRRLLRGHKLTRLYEALPNATKSWLTKKFEITYTGRTLSEVLSSFDDIFIEWRYLFEGNAPAVCLSDLLDLVTLFE